MKETKLKVKPKSITNDKKIDYNPISKPNTEFRNRHDISIEDFKRYASRFQSEYGQA